VTLDIPGGNAGVNVHHASVKLMEEFGVDHLDKLADLQMFFVPQGAEGGAYAFVQGSISVYGDIW
jgi:hypothetical protein